MWSRTSRLHSLSSFQATHAYKTNMTKLAMHDGIDFKGNFMHKGLDSDHSITGNCVFHFKFGLNVQNVLKIT